MDSFIATAASSPNRYAGGMIPSMILPTIALYLTLLVCAVGVGVMVYKYDLYRREPLGMILLAVALGAGAMWVATHAQLGAIQLIWNSGRTVSDPVLALFAGVTEELAKLSVVAFIALAMRRVFDEPLDGIIYGSFTGLGVALIESVWFISGVQGLSVIPAQEPVRLAGHLIMGGIGGFGMGLLTVRSRLALLWILASFLGAVLLHTLWDVVAFGAANQYQRAAQVRTGHTAAGVALMLSGMIAYRWLISVGARMTRAKLGVCDLATKRCPPR